MDQIWRYMMFLVFLETALITYFFSLISESSVIDISNNRKRDNVYVHIRMKFNTTVESIQDGIENGNESTAFAHLKKDQPITSILIFLSKRHVITNLKKIHKSSNQQQHVHVKSKKSPILESKGRLQRDGQNANVTKLNATNEQNTTNRYETLSNEKFNVPMKNLTFCTFSFDNNSLLQARRQLSQSINLFYVNLKINGLHSNLGNVRDEILHWQYVLKDEKFLVQLPVDFDLLTYGLLIHDHEETVLKVNLTYNNSNCLENNDSEKIQIVRLLLWKELFQNDTKHYLCNRDFEKQRTRNFVYYLTTVWVGEDLNCTGLSSKYGLYNMKAKKDHLPLVTPVFCYILSLQFVWIFLLLDTMKLGNKRDTVVTESPKKFKTIDLNKREKCVLIKPCPTFSQTDQKPSFTRNDRPYGLKQLVLKLLFRKSCCFKHSLLHNFHMRLLFLMWFFILLPFGLYRTIGRYYLLKHLNEDYLDVFRPSEPFFTLFSKDNELKCIIVDACYATASPFIYIFVGQYLYEIFMSKNKRKICCCFIEEEEELLIENVDTISDRFTFRYSQFCRKVNKLLCLKDCCKNTTCKKWCKSYFSCRCDSSCRDDICMCLYSSISVPFPIFPFVCFSHKYICLSECNNCKDGNCSCVCWCLLFIVRCFCNVGLFIILYILCLRPIFSTFTFMLRSFTHIFFVALPNRAAILRYTLLIFTTIGYFVKYIHQLINMNAEILNYIFKLNEKEISSQPNNTENSDKHVENIDEEMFDAIYDELTFVKKRFYFLYLKIVVVFMYLFITIETFITNTKALTGPNFQQILQFFLIIIGPYAVSLFLKANKDDFLTEENKRDIKAAFIRVQSVKQDHQSDTLC